MLKKKCINKVKGFLPIVILAIATMLIILTVYCFIYMNKLIITSYTVETDLKNPVRIVQLTDLHQAEFGENNIELIKLVKEQTPDIIVMTGDMQNKNDSNSDMVCLLVEELSSIADVYYGYGNHEISWLTNFGSDLENKLTDAGAIVLNNSFSDISINGNMIRIAGFEGYYGTPHMTEQDKEKKEYELEFMRQFENTDKYKILLDHIPTSWVDWQYINKYPVDLVLSGHYHGGVIRIPVINQGVYAPYVGWFPSYTKGVYIGTQATCVLSTGLGSEQSIPRLNNPTEIVVVDLVPKDL